MQLGQKVGDRGLCSFKVDVGARNSAAKASPTHAVALPVMSQQNGVFARDRQTLAIMTRCMPKGSNDRPE